ncbi:MAG: hypothetical protein DRI90_04130 [Deltaproteobacteria bacterium]|nr:MAG: hypothetical protein DRI90_04130 [Deltaproteobacteria bacterium]
MNSIAHPKPRSLALCILVGLLSLTGVAQGDDAKAAFQEGMKLLATGDYDGACAAFERSESPAPTVSTQYQLGRCNESRGRLGSAHRFFLSAAGLAEEAGDAARAKTARQRAREVEPKAGKMAIIIPQDRQVEGLTVTCDGIDVPQKNWGKAVPIDSGKHTIVLSAPGMETKSIEAQSGGPGKPTLVEAPALEPGGGAATTPTATPPAPPPPGDAGPEMVRKSNGAFWAGMGLTIGGGLAILGGVGLWVQDETADAPIGPIALLIGGSALLGVGLPLMFVFGKKVPAGPDGEPLEEAAEGAIYLQPLIGPTGAGLRLRF